MTHVAAGACSLFSRFLPLISPCIMCVQCRGGCSVPLGDIMSTVGGDILSTVGDIMINVGGYLEYRGRYHEYRGGLS